MQQVAINKICVEAFGQKSTKITQIYSRKQIILIYHSIIKGKPENNCFMM